LATAHYVIRGGVDGRERLRVLGRVMRPTTLEFLRRAGVAPGSVCLDAGCGGGDVTVDLARITGPTGRVVGIDLDHQKIEFARAEAKALGAANVEFRVADVAGAEFAGKFDVVYCRFVLTHLPQPAQALAAMANCLRPGGKMLLTDIDCSGYFWYPDSPVQSRFLHLYTSAVRGTGGDPDIGPRLPELLTRAGFEQVGMDLVQPAGIEGEVKLIGPLTMENISDAVIAQGLASPEEVQQIVQGLYDFARSPGTVCSIPRIFEAWGTWPSAGATGKS